MSGKYVNCKKCNKEVYRHFYRLERSKTFYCSFECSKSDAKGKSKKHGMSNSKFYYIWSQIKDRCKNPNNIRYKDYGGRGVIVCDEWKIFDNFKNDMYPFYKEGMQIERIDVNGNYCKENCKWVTAKEQYYNQRKTVFLEKDGVKKSTVEWAEILGIKLNTIYYRLRRGWSHGEALSVAMNKRREGRGGFNEQQKRHEGINTFKYPKVKDKNN
jgi:hypothetical protein